MLFKNMKPLMEGKATCEMTEEQITILRLLKISGLDARSVTYACEKLDRLELVRIK